ncbi:AAA family ATPase [uncultured Roseibium sp.]|uniref:AAA family ATPase n=1 Tax=uncultured Roseibium sp. TaxID=1936171 RepID=UPI00263780CF|nr:AAA family ATPase [uncultured Roseibium sp.]
MSGTCEEARLTIRLLGGCDMRIDNQPLTLPTRHCALILAFLAAEHEIEHSRARIANLFWSDRGEDQARGSLRQALYQLRKAFEPFGLAPLTSTAKSICLNREQIWCDVHDLQNGHIGSLSDFRGDFLLGWEISAPEFSDWMAEKRADLRTIVSDLSASAIEDADRSGDFVALTRHAQRLVKLDPFSEDHVRRLMTLFARNGEVASAVDTYRRLEERLSSELQVSPSNETRALLAEIENRPRAEAVGPVSGSEQEMAVAGSANENVPPLHKSQLSKLPDERRQLTVLGITTEAAEPAETSTAPEFIAKRMDLLKHRIESVARRHGGSWEQSSGTAFLVYFGWPEMHEDTIKSAMKAAVDLREAVDRETGTRCRIGISTGDVLIAAADRSIVGGPPNHALHLMGHAAPGDIVVAEGTRSLLGDRFAFEDLPLSSGAVAYRYQRHLTGPENATPEFLDLVGRHREFELLLDRWHLSANGEGQLVIVKGEPGIGKSRLAQAFLEELRRESAHPIVLQCSRQTKDRPLYPIGEHIILSANLDLTQNPERNWQILDRFLENSGVVSEDDRNVIGYCAGIIPLEKQLDGLSLRNAVLQALGNYLQSQSEGCPVVVLLEDAQWADPTTLDLLQHVAATLSHHSLMLMLAARPAFQHQAFEAFDPTVFSLSRLSRNHVADLVRKLAKGKSVSTNAVDVICERSDGVPLFAEELVNGIVQSGSGAEAVPNSLKDILVARLNKLGESRHYAFRAACLGRRFTRNLLEFLCTDLPGSVDAALEAMLDARLIFPFPKFGPDAFCFRHALLRDAAYESIPAMTREVIHRSIYDCLLARNETKHDLLAWHAARAGLRQDAVRHLRVAASDTLRKFAHGEARAHLEQALNLIDQGDFGETYSETRLALLSELARCFAHSDGFGHARTASIVEDAVRLSTDLPGNPVAARVLWQSYCVHHIRANHHEIERIGKEMLTLNAWDDSVGIQEVVGKRAIAVGEFLAGHFDAADEGFERAMALIEKTPNAPSIGGATDVDQLISMRLIRIRILAMRGHSDLALELLHEIEEISRKTGHPQNQITTFASASYIYLMLEKYARAVDAAEVARALAAKFKLSMWEAYSELMLTTPKMHEAFSAALTDDYQNARRKLQTSSAQFSVLLYDAHFACLLARCAQTDRTQQVLKVLFDQINQGIEPWCHPEVIRLAAEAGAISNSVDPADVRTWLEKALSIAETQGSVLWRDRIQAALHSAG